MSAGLAAVLVSLLVWAKPDNEITIAIVAAASTILATVLTIVLTSDDAKTRELEESHRIPKAEAYGKLVEIVTSIFRLIKIRSRTDLNSDQKESEQAKLKAKLEDDYLSASRQLLVWGSPQVIQAWLRFRAYSQVVTAQAEENLEDALHNFLYMDDVLRAVREDLGLATKELKEGELVKAFLSDPEIIDRVVGKQARLAAHNPALHRTANARRASAAR